MDTLSATLDGHRARGAHVLHVEMARPWSIAVEDEATLGLLVMVRGRAHLLRDGHAPVTVGPGDVVVTSSGLEYAFADDVATPPSIVIGPGEVSRDLVGTGLCVALSHGVRRWGTAVGPAAPGEDEFVCATYSLGSQVTGRLVEALPDLVVLRADDWGDRGGAALVDVLVGEMSHDRPGQDAVVDRLVDLVLIAVLREWFSRPGSDAPAWWVAQGDPVVGPVLALMHDAPGEPWSLDRLAREVRVSRATLARRFTELVGESPMAYLTQWRIALAADLLTDTDATVEHVAGRVGYASAFAFSAAFKKARGTSPRSYRMGARRAG